MNKKGFTLIELIVSIAILSVVMTGIVTVFSNGFRLFAHANEIGKTQYELRQYAEGSYEGVQGVEVVKQDACIVLPNGTSISVTKVTVQVEGVSYTFYE